MQALKILFLPISWIYGGITFIRNKFFDWGIFKTYEFSSSVISVGNLSAGGTGKTPLVEYLINLMKNEYQLATLSRGYKRKTHGFLIADATSTAYDIGDEPLQYKMKFPDLIVAVDSKRKRGIEQLREIKKEIATIILDDAFQHRKVKAGLSIVLSDYSKLYFEDSMLPYGTLRESASGIKRADIIVVTKAPKNLTPIDKRIIIKKINALDYQKIYFSFIVYDKPVALTEVAEQVTISEKTTVLMLSGIANPIPLQEHLNSNFKKVIPMVYADHYDFKKEDMFALTESFEEISSSDKIIITTEKDWMRLRKTELQDWVKKLPLFYVVIKTDFKEKDKEEFNLQILNYVRTN